MPKVVVACGSGVATSQVVADRLRRLLGERGVVAEVVACPVGELAQNLVDADAYVSVVKADDHADVPVFNGVAFLTGQGQQEELDRLAKVLRG